MDTNQAKISHTIYTWLIANLMDGCPEGEHTFHMVRAEHLKQLSDDLAEALTETDSTKPSNLVPLQFKEMEFNELRLEVAFRVYPDEERNHGHPDRRLPNVMSEIDIANVSVVDFPVSRIQEKLVNLFKDGTQY